MMINIDMTDRAILAEIGDRLRTMRLNANQSIDELAKQAQVSPRTVNRIEAGESVRLENFIAVLRVRRRLSALEALLPEPGISPIQMLRLAGKQRQRASGTRGSRKGSPKR